MLGWMLAVWKIFRFRGRFRTALLADPKRLGELGEWIAHVHLLRLGYDVVARRWEAPFGEVDLIARRDGAWHFIEVKTRREDDVHQPEDAVTAEKETRYHQLARYFMKQHGLLDQPARFHIVPVEFDESGKWRVRFIRNAF